MRISLSDAGKRFNQDWIFRHINIDLPAGARLAITGPNGSGKSTLLQAIGNLLTLTEGRISYDTGEGRRLPENIYRDIAFSAPYLELIEEMTLVEFLSFHGKFKPWLQGLTPIEIISILRLEPAAQKQLRYFSSGMKQRVKLAQCLLSGCSILLLDEPCSNLDAAGIAQYLELIAQYGGNRTIIVSSNDPQEYPFCTGELRILDYK